MPPQRATTMSHLLTNAYAPVVEEVTVQRPTVEGALPPKLDGRFVAVGANPLGGYDPAVDHQFAGDAMLHGLRLRGGRAEWYRNRWLRTDRVCAALGELPTPGPRRGLSDNANAGLVEHAGRLLALGGGGVPPHQIGPELGTVARIDLDGALPGGLCSGPVTDPLTGELHAVGRQADGDGVSYVVVDPRGRVRSAEPVTVKSSPMMPGLGLTDRHAVLLDLPVTRGQRVTAADPRVPYAWDEGHGARLGVLPRDGGDPDVLWTEVEPCFVFHPVNAYESGRRVVLDVIRHQRAFDRDPLHPSESRPTLWRWTVDRIAGLVTENQLSSDAQEFPAIDQRYAGGPHRFVWSVGLPDGHGAALGGPRLLRHDLRDGHTDAHRLEPGQEAGAPVFVPRGGCAEEGDGWLLTLVYDAATGRSALHVIDTRGFTDAPVAVVALPVRVPHALDALWTDTR